MISNKKKLENKELGITLIALVITIIVLLILASVSIAMLTGNNGILTQAKLAKENTQVAKEDEENKLSNNNEYINAKTGNAVPGEIVTETKKDNYVDTNGEKATIPEGFSVDETDNIVSKGLVIHGPDKENGDNGSEFVWVPVPDINNTSQCSVAGGNCNLQLEDNILKCKTHDNNKEIVGKLYATNIGEDFGVINTEYSANSGLREPDILNGNDSGDTDINLESMKKDYLKMATSVAEYGGFYVGRYETSLSDVKEDSAGTSEKPQSKEGVIPTSAGDSATYMWYGLYKVQNKTYTGTNDSVESSMIWGSQYDAIINWAKNGKDKDKISDTNLGNHGGSTANITGNSKYSYDSINNIKDLGGNLREWSLEAYNNKNRIFRGGGFGYDASIISRGAYATTYKYKVFGSRMTLIIL